MRKWVEIIGLLSIFMPSMMTKSASQMFLQEFIVKHVHKFLYAEISGHSTVSKPWHEKSFLLNTQSGNLIKHEPPLLERGTFSC